MILVMDNYDSFTFNKEYPVEGVQFHPESILTSFGGRILENFVRKVRAGERGLPSRISRRKKDRREESSNRIQERRKS